jgi:hypothetical protein
MDTEQGASPLLDKKAWPLMTPAERRAKWERFREGATFDAQDFIEHIERGRDEADRPLPPRTQ